MILLLAPGTDHVLSASFGRSVKLSARLAPSSETDALQKLVSANALREDEFAFAYPYVCDEDARNAANEFIHCWLVALPAETRGKYARVPIGRLAGKVA